MSKILLIEDDKLVMRSLQRVLDARGHNITTAGNGLEAEHALDNQTFDLIITDILMPQMDGIQVIMKTRHENKLTTPILAISGGGRADAANYLESAQELGADEILKKPFTNELLLEAVKRLTAAA